MREREASLSTTMKVPRWSGSGCGADNKPHHKGKGRGHPGIDLVRHRKGEGGEIWGGGGGGKLEPTPEDVEKVVMCHGQRLHFLQP